MNNNDNDKMTVVGIGELLWDMLPGGKKIGGAPANFAYHVSQFGIPATVVSAVGCDELGDELMQELSQKPMGMLIDKVGYPTGTVAVELAGKGMPTYDIKQNVAWDNIPFTPELEALAKRTRAVCFGSLAQRSDVSRSTIQKFISAMPDEPGRLKIFDINLRQGYHTPQLIEKSLEVCNVLKINDEELEVLGRMFDLPDGGIKEICRTLLERYNLDILVLTCGVNGSWLFTPDAVSFKPTPKVEVADTVGAGDSFTAAFTAAILGGKTVDEAHELAVKLSSFVCTQHGAMPLHPESL